MPMFTLGSFSGYEEVRNGGFSEFCKFCGSVIIRLRICSKMSVLQLSQHLSKNDFED